MSPIASALAAFRSGKGLKGQLLRGGVGSVAIKIASTGLNLVLAIVLARALGAEAFGVYSFVFALITIIAIPAQMGLPNLVVRETAKAQANGDWALMKGLWRWSTIMALAMSAALIAIGALTAWLFASQLPEGGLTVFYWGLVLVPLIALGNLRGAALRGLRHVVQGQLPEFILRPGFLIVLVLAMHFGLSARALTASDAMMLHAVASLVAFSIGAWMLMRARPSLLTTEPGYASKSGVWLASALPLGMVEGMQLINQNVGIIIIGIFSTAEDVGVFRVALQGAAVLTFGLAAINLAISAHFARLHALGDIARLQRLVTLCARSSFSLAIPLAIAFYFFGQDILSVLFGQAFVSAYNSLLLLMIGQLSMAFAGPVGYLLYMTGFERDVVWGVTISAIANVCLTIMLVPNMGIGGAAAAMTTSLIVWNAFLVFRVNHRLKLDSTALGLTRVDMA